MATISAPKPAEPLVSVEEYLGSIYHPDCEYIDGRIEERNLGQFDHALFQALLASLFTNNGQAWSIRTLTEWRAQVSSTHFRIPDVTVIRRGLPKEPILTHPPLIAIEILSPGDRRGQVEEKLDDYFAFGIENIWIFDTERRTVQIATPGGLQLVTNDELTVPGTPIRVVPSELFAQLD